MRLPKEVLSVSSGGNFLDRKRVSPAQAMSATGHVSEWLAFVASEVFFIQ
jgi:hypothetical protein